MWERLSFEGEQLNFIIVLYWMLEIYEMQSGNVELCQNFNQSSKLVNFEQILDFRNFIIVLQFEDVFVYCCDQVDIFLEQWFVMIL